MKLLKILALTMLGLGGFALSVLADTSMFRLIGLLVFYASTHALVVMQATHSTYSGTRNDLFREIRDVQNWQNLNEIRSSLNSIRSNSDHKLH